MDPSAVTCDPGTRWGTPCLRNTGITVAAVVALRRSGYSDERVLEALPALSAEDLEAALEWHARFGDDALGPEPPPPGDRYPRIAAEPQIQGGQPVIRGTRITVDAVCGLHAAGRSTAEILDEFPGLVPDDVVEALCYDAEVHP